MGHKCHMYPLRKASQDLYDHNKVLELPLQTRFESYRSHMRHLLPILIPRAFDRVLQEQSMEIPAGNSCFLGRRRDVAACLGQESDQRVALEDRDHPLLRLEEAPFRRNT